MWWLPKRSVRAITCGDQTSPLVHGGGRQVAVPAIVAEFAALCKRYEIMYCDAIIARNRDVVLPATRTEAQRAGRSYAAVAAGNADLPRTDMDAFFMFEPYGLRRTSSFIQPHYQEWTGQVRPAGRQARRAVSHELIAISSSL